jgi:hypothetical protein
VPRSMAMSLEARLNRRGIRIEDQLFPKSAARICVSGLGVYGCRERRRGRLAGARQCRGRRGAFGRAVRATRGCALPNPKATSPWNKSRLHLKQANYCVPAKECRVEPAPQVRGSSGGRSDPTLTQSGLPLSREHKREQVRHCTMLRTIQATETITSLGIEIHYTIDIIG